MSNCADFFEFSQKNKPQSNALAGGIMVLLVSGMQIGWIFDNSVHLLSWTDSRSTPMVNFAYMSFYIAGILGLMSASATINRLTKRNIYVSHVVCTFS